MTTALKSRIEKFFKDELDLRIPNLPVFVNKRDLSVDIVGSYAVCRVKSMEEIYQSREVYYGDVQIWVFSNSDDTTAEAHSLLVEEVSRSITDSYCQNFNDGARDFPAGCRVYGWGPKEHDEEEHQQVWGDVIQFQGGFGNCPGPIPQYDVDSGAWVTAYSMKRTHHETKKIDATLAPVTAIIPADTIKNSAYVSNGPLPLSVTKNGQLIQLEPGEVELNEQTVMPGNVLGTNPGIQVHFPLGSKGTVNYVADQNLGPIVCN